MIDPGALQAFCYVGRLGGIGAAARELRVTQSAVSQRIRKLETKLGKKLYGRTGRRIVLTDDGARIYDICRQAFDILVTVESFADGKDAPLRGSVRIASLSEIGKAFLLPKIRNFRRENPAVEFDLKYRLPYEMLAPLMRHDVDLILSNESFRRPQVQSVPILKQTVVCVGPGPSRRLSKTDLETLPWLAYGEEDPLWLELEELASRAGVRLSRPSFSIADTDSILRLAADGVGYALAPEHALKLRNLPGLAVHRLPFPPIIKQIYLCRLKTVPMGRAAQAFWDSLRPS